MMFNIYFRRVVPYSRRRRGAILAKLGILLPVLIGFVGLTVDGGMMLSSKRQAQNAADAAATAAATELIRGESAATALATANAYVQDKNGLSAAPPLVAGTTFHNPPASGPHQGKSNYVEVIVRVPHETFFMHILTGEKEQAVGARAVAGFEAVTSGEGVIVLDPDPPGGSGLTVGGNAVLRVEGRIVVNSEHGGVDEDGKAVVGLSSSPASKINNNEGIFAEQVDVVGGVNAPDMFHPYEPGGDSPLNARSLPVPDPLINLPVPTVATGVDPTSRGAISVTNGSVTGIVKNATGYVEGTNSVALLGDIVGNGLHAASLGEVILHPGVYDSMKITGGNVYMLPGVYVVAGGDIAITGGMIRGENIMIYNTGDNYNPLDGTPDIYDGNEPPPAGGPADGANFGAISFNSSVIASPINTQRITELVGGYNLLYPGAKAVSSEYDGILFFQRRQHTGEVKIVGNAADGALTGTLYAKWAPISLSGQGAYDAQFIVGSMSVSGNGNVSVLGAGDSRGRANNLFLVE